MGEYGSALHVDLPVDQPVVEVMTRFGNVLMMTLVTTPLLSLFRLVVGEAERFPHLAETFYERGPRRGKARAAVWVAAKMERGELRAGDPMQAVRHFAGLCQSGIYQHAVLGLPEGRETGRIAAEVDAAVATFHRAWGPETPG